MVFITARSPVWLNIVASSLFGRVETGCLEESRTQRVIVPVFPLDGVPGKTVEYEALKVTCSQVGCMLILTILHWPWKLLIAS